MLVINLPLLKRSATADLFIQSMRLSMGNSVTRTEDASDLIAMMIVFVILLCKTTGYRLVMHITAVTFTSIRFIISTLASPQDRTKFSPSLPNYRTLPKVHPTRGKVFAVL